MFLKSGATAAASVALVMLMFEMSCFSLAGVGETNSENSFNPMFLFHNSVCVCVYMYVTVFVCVHACALPPDCTGMRQPSQLEGYLGTCVLRESPRANALGMLQHRHTHKHTYKHTPIGKNLITPTC